MNEQLGAWALDSVNNVDLFALCDGLPDGSIDCIAADLPYSVTQNKWDELIPLAPMWAAFRRVIKMGGAIVLTATNPFSSLLVSSALDLYRDEWIWNKPMASGFLNANRYPMRCHEHVLVFCDSAPPYYPQMSKGEPYRALTASKSANYGAFEQIATISVGERFPRTVLDFANETGLHPTQKPLSLFSYLIRTYTQPGDVVLDPTCGSGTTALAARGCGRHFIIGDIGANWCELSRMRLAGRVAEHKAREAGQPFTLPLWGDGDE